MPRAPSYLLQVASSAIAATGCLWASTQLAAARLGNQPALGPSWITLAGWPVYKPWQLFPWWLAFDAQAPTIFAEAGAIAACGGVLSSLIAFGGAARRASQNKTLTNYGSARWADKSEIAKAGLLGNSGIVLGAYVIFRTTGRNIHRILPGWEGWSGVRVGLEPGWAGVLEGINGVC